MTDRKGGFATTTTPPLAYKLKEAAEVSKLGRTALYEAIRGGELSARKRGKSIIILADDLCRFLYALPLADLKKPTTRRDRLVAVGGLK